MIESFVGLTKHLHDFLLALIDYCKNSMLLDSFFVIKFGKYNYNTCLFNKNVICAVLHKPVRSMQKTFL